MFSRFIAGLTSPKKITEFRYDKWYYPFLVILLMIIIALIPITYYSINTEILTYEMQKSIRTSFLSGEIVEYSIEDNKLVYLQSSENKTIVNTSYGNFIFSTYEVEYSDLGSSLNYIFFEDHISVYYGTIKFASYNYVDLENFNGLDFRLAKVDDYDFWNKVFGDVAVIFDEIKPFFVTGNIIANLIFVLGDVLVCALLISLLIKFQTKEPYACSFKMAFYASVPTFVGMVLSLMYDVTFINTIGMIWSFVFAYRISFLLRFKGGN